MSDLAPGAADREIDAISLPRAILFDLDDTLHDDTTAFENAAEEVAREVAAEHGVDALALKEAYVSEAHGFWHRLSGKPTHGREHPSCGSGDSRH